MRRLDKTPRITLWQTPRRFDHTTRRRHHALALAHQIRLHHSVESLLGSRRTKQSEHQKFRIDANTHCFAHRPIRRKPLSWQFDSRRRKVDKGQRCQKVENQINSIDCATGSHFFDSQRLNKPSKNHKNASRTISEAFFDAFLRCSDFVSDNCRGSRHHR